MIQLLSSRTEVTPELAADIAAYADGIGPSLRLIYGGLDESGNSVISPLVNQAQALGLEVHPYTLRADELIEGVDSFYELLKICFVTIGVSGVFTDFCDQVEAYLRDSFDP